MFGNAKKWRRIHSRRAPHFRGGRSSKRRRSRWRRRRRSEVAGETLLSFSFSSSPEDVKSKLSSSSSSSSASLRPPPPPGLDVVVAADAAFRRRRRRRGLSRGSTNPCMSRLVVPPGISSLEFWVDSQNRRRSAQTDCKQTNAHHQQPTIFSKTIILLVI